METGQWIVLDNTSSFLWEQTTPDNYHSSNCASIAQMLYGFARWAITGWTSRTYELCGFGDNCVVYGILVVGTHWNTGVITTSHSVPKKWVLCVFLAQSQTQWVGDFTVCYAHWQGLRAWPGPEFGRRKTRWALKTQHNRLKAESNWSKAAYVYSQMKRPSSCSKALGFYPEGEGNADGCVVQKEGRKIILLQHASDLKSVIFMFNRFLSSEMCLFIYLFLPNLKYMLLVSLNKQHCMMWDDCNSWWWCGIKKEQCSANTDFLFGYGNTRAQS